MPQDVSVHKLLRLLVPKKRATPTPEERAALDKFKDLWTEDRQHELLGDFLRKPGCGGCIDKVVAFVTQDARKMQELVDLVDPTGEKTKPSSGPSRRDQIRGLIRDIDDTESAFRELLNEMYKRGVRFSITIRALDEGRIRVYFY